MTDRIREMVRQEADSLTEEARPIAELLPPAMRDQLDAEDRDSTRQPTGEWGMGAERKTVMQMWEEANEKVKFLKVEELAEHVEAGTELLLVDVRMPAEVERWGTIADSVLAPRGVLEWWADPVSPYFRPGGPFGDFGRTVITSCDGGGNGAFTALALQELGYRNVATLEGGYNAWLDAELPTVRS